MRSGNIKTDRIWNPLEEVSLCVHKERGSVDGGADSAPNQFQWQEEGSNMSNAGESLRGSSEASSLPNEAGHSPSPSLRNLSHLGNLYVAPMLFMPFPFLSLLLPTPTHHLMPPGLIHKTTKTTKRQEVKCRSGHHVAYLLQVEG